jgi:hypothetical protein
MRLRRFLPSPAMIVALTALVLSLGGSAYALVVTGKTIRNNSVTNADIRQRTLTGNDMRRDKVGGGSIKESSLGTVPAASLAGVANGSARFAVVGGAGQLRRGRGISSVARTGMGRYQAIFQNDVRNCGYWATIGDPSAAGPPANSQVSVSSLGSNVNGVAIRTANSNNNQADRPFHLLVLC